MTRNFKALNLALVAVFAMTAIMASSAQAVNHHFDVPQTPAIIPGEGESAAPLTLTVGFEKVKCTVGWYRGTVSEKTNTQLTLVPELAGCERVGSGEGVTVDVNHCAFVFKGNTDAEEHAPLEIECADKSEISVTFPTLGCTLHFPAQTPKEGVHYYQTKFGSSLHITAELTATKLKYTRTGGFKCLFLGEGEEGSLNGGITLLAFDATTSPETCTKGLTGTDKTTPLNHVNSCLGFKRLDLKLETT